MQKVYFVLLFSNNMFFNFICSKVKNFCVRISNLVVIPILVFVFIVSSVLFLSISTRAYTSNFQKSVNIRARSPEDFASASFQETVRKMASLGANSISLVVQYDQNGINGTNFYSRYDTPTDSSLVNAINYIKSQGMKPSLKMFVESSDGSWRALINPSDRNGWFANYTTLLKKYAQLSQMNNLEIFNLGTEMAKMTMPSYNSDNTRQWRELIRQVRQSYSGKLTYGANHGEPFSEVNTLEFWDALDYIGVSAYFTLSSSELPSVQELTNSWQYTAAQVLEPLANRYQKQIIFTEIGYRSVNKTAQTPGDWSQPRYFMEDGQVNAFEALFGYFENKSYMYGFQIWDVSSDPNYGGSGNTDYTFVNKKAENTIRTWYGRQSTSSFPPLNPNAKIGPAGKFAIETKNRPNPIIINQNSNLKIELQNRTYQNYSATILLQVYNSLNQPVHSDVYYNQNYASADSKLYTSNWTPIQTGNYTLRIGVFAPNWSNTVEWFEDGMTNLSVGNAASSSASSSVLSSSSIAIFSPSSKSSSSVASSSSLSSSISSLSSSSISTPQSSSSVSVSNSSSNSPTSSQIEIWWPSNGGSVSGSQPFKAIVQNKSIDSYQMSWKVDDGVLNSMYTSNEGYPHKKSWVDLSGWTWKGSNQAYKVTFVATQNGQIIAQKNISIITN